MSFRLQEVKMEEAHRLLGNPYFSPSERELAYISIEVAGQDESVDLARPAPLCLNLSVVGGTISIMGEV
jgi:hypothetical protein